jgi:hypothetical protein
MHAGGVGPVVGPGSSNALRNVIRAAVRLAPHMLTTDDQPRHISTKLNQDSSHIHYLVIWSWNLQRSFPTCIETLKTPSEETV